MTNNMGGAARSGNVALASMWLNPATRAEAAKTVIRAVRAAKEIGFAADALGVSYRTLHRWIMLHEELKELRVDRRK